ncbi:MAG: type II toxin-antitoxin system RelE/ParE family toxin [Candidatus Binataceae bacterium]
MGLRWTRAANQDLESVERYIGRDNPHAAIDVVLEIIWQVEMLVEHPGMGRLGRVEGTRELVVGGLPYVVPYIHHGGVIIILRVLHGAMKWPDQF